MNTRRLLGPALLITLCAPAIVAWSPTTTQIEQELTKAREGYMRCIAQVGPHEGVARKCEEGAMNDLRRVEGLIRPETKEDGPTRTATRARIARVRAEIKRHNARHIQQLRRQRAQKPQDAKRKLDSTSDLLGGVDADESPASAAPKADPAPRMKRSSTRASGVAAESYAPPRRPMPRPMPRPKPMPSPSPIVVRPPVPTEQPPVEQPVPHRTNARTKTSEDRLSTFAADVDTGSYTLARGTILGGSLPRPEQVRVEEFVNYFKYDYPAPSSGAFAVALEAAPSPFTADKKTYLMRVGVQGRKVPASKRKPVHLTFLVDVSGSMNRPDKLGMAKDALRTLTNNLKPGDTVALATYASGSKVILEPTSVSNKDAIFEGINGLKAGGSTAMSDGLQLAYKLALTNYKRDHVNRVLVMSDGDANVGGGTHQEILKKIKHYVEEGVTLSTIGFGRGGYRDHLMEQLANQGNGNYYYIDSKAEAERIFGEQIDGTLEVIAKDVKIQVEFNPKAVTTYRLIGYENRDVADKDFRNDKVDAGEVGSGHTVTALYEIEVADPNARTLATVRIRHKQPQGYKAVEQAFTMGSRDVRRKLRDGSRDLQLAAAVAGFAEILRGSPYAKNLSFSLVEEVARAASSPKEKDRQEFLKIVARSRQLSGKK